MMKTHQLTAFPKNPDAPKIREFLSQFERWLNFTILSLVVTALFIPWWLSIIAFVLVMGVWDKATAHRPFNVGLIVLAHAVLPAPVFFAMVPMVSLFLEDKWYFDGYVETRRAVDVYLSRVAIANAEAHFTQLGMEYTSMVIADDYSDGLRTDREPGYYRMFRDNLRKLCATVMTQRESVPRDLWLGHDVATMREISQVYAEAAVKSDMLQYKARRTRLEAAAMVEYV